MAVLAVGFGLGWSMPNSDASPGSVVRYYVDHHGRTNTAAILTAVSVPVGLFFFVLLREFLLKSERARPFSTIALAGAIVFGCGGALSAGLTFSLTDVPSRLTPGAAQALNVLNNNLVGGLMIAGLATMQLAFGIAFLVGKAFPAWLGWLTLAIGVVSLLGPLAFIGFIATGVWVLIVSALIYSRMEE
ncbi:MAG TPA: hypothetical protein VL551_07975 [Actinospica sp.]|nr:hypothetical protein [Actinospica sp.]